MEGKYTVTYRGKTDIVESFNSFVLQLVNPCPLIEFNLKPSPFQEQ
jgi:hypothetical protein